jgi:hypothetical protein
MRFYPLLSVLLLLCHFSPLHSDQLGELKQQQAKIDRLKGRFKTVGRNMAPTIYNASLKDPSLQRIIFNTTPQDLSTCIITYSTLNPPYPSSIKRQIDCLRVVNYQGHYLFRIGGWPDMENGSLKYSTTPYGFKFCALMEAYRLGYKRVLWLDCKCLPIQNPSPLFEKIRRKNFVYRQSKWPFSKYCTAAIRKTFKLKASEERRIKHIATGVLGFNFESKKVQKVLHELYATLNHPTAYDSFFPEQLVMSIILHRNEADIYALENLIQFNSAPTTKKTFFHISYN